MNKFTFGFIGTFGYWHGIDVLERIIPMIIEHNKNVHFLLIGDGVLKNDLEKSLKEKNISEFVTFTGTIAQEKGPEYLAMCDAFLCPTQPNSDGSRFFGSPTKLFEYLSMAKPVIASDLEQLSEIISPAIHIKGEHVRETEITDQVGVLVDPLDIQGFVTACVYIMQLSENQRTLMGNNARSHVIEKYTWKQHVKKIVDHAQL